MSIYEFLSRFAWNLLDVAEFLDLNRSLGDVIGWTIWSLSDLLVGFEFHLLKVVLINKVIKWSKPWLLIFLLLIGCYLHDLPVPLHYVAVWYHEATVGHWLTVIRHAVNAICDQMVEGISNCKTPMHKELPKYLAKKVHGKTSPELYMVELKMIVDESQGWTYADTGLALEDDLKALEEIAVVEVDWKKLLLLCEGFEDEVKVLDSP